MKIQIDGNKIVNAKTLIVTAKCSDCFCATLLDIDEKEITNYNGYVPDFFPGKHFGDYVELNIDIETGMIKNWTKPTQEALEFFVNNK